MAEYAQAAKILGEYQKPGAEFPTEGLGYGATEGCKAVRAIKIMAKHYIELAVLDEAAAVDGSRPLEQVADSSGIAWGAACTSGALGQGISQSLPTPTAGHRHTGSRPSPWG